MAGCKKSYSKLSRNHSSHNVQSFLVGPLNIYFLEKLGSGNLADIESHDLPPASSTTDSWSRGRVNVVKRINHEIQSRSQSRVSAGINVAFPPSTIGDTDSNGMMAPSARPNILEHQEERTYQEHMSRANTERTDETLPTVKSMQKQTEETNITRTKNVSPYQVLPQPNFHVLPPRKSQIHFPVKPSPNFTLIFTPIFQFRRYTGRVKSANLKNITTPLDKAEETVSINFYT